MSLGNVARSTSSTRWPFRASSNAVAAPLHRAPITMASYIGPSRPTSLPARRVRVSLRDVDRRPMIQVGDSHGCIVHEARDARHIRIIDVLRLVGHLVIVEMLAARERD